MVERIDARSAPRPQGSESAFGRGGMLTKLEAAQTAAAQFGASNCALQRRHAQHSCCACA